MNDGGHTHSMAPAPPSNATMMMHHRHMMMHMTFFWGKNAEILFDGWPGSDHLGMYVLALTVVFFLAFIVEWLSNCSILRGSSSPSQRSAAAAVGMLQTLLYAVRIGLAYLVMLAVMSFNAGVFLVAIAGHSIGFFLFGSRAFNKQAIAPGKTSDLPPMNCC
ncbi:Copper transporter 1 [Sesamum angolense]|uniref:Copper transport protein n=1 Tax=Sesamum angolense TaxID=2727404 RepID=A0AAE2C4C2_9LAMI|nr:Copper transporter 1 [Sesamum angolense]